MEPSHRVDVRPVALLAALAQPDLRLAEVRLQIVVYHVEVLVGGELPVGRQRDLNEELALLGVDVQPVAGIEADLLADARDEPVHFLVEIRGVVDHVEIGMADPSGGGVVVQLARQLYALGAAYVVLTENGRISCVFFKGVVVSNILTSGILCICIISGSPPCVLIW